MKTQLLKIFLLVVIAIVIYVVIEYVYNANRSVNTNQVITVPPSEDFDNTIGERH